MGGSGYGSLLTLLPGVLPGAISITANNARNALVVGTTQNRMADKAPFRFGPWQPLGNEARARRSSPPPSPSRPSCSPV